MSKNRSSGRGPKWTSVFVPDIWLVKLIAATPITWYLATKEQSSVYVSEIKDALTFSSYAEAKAICSEQESPASLVRIVQDMALGVTLPE